MTRLRSDALATYGHQLFGGDLSFQELTPEASARRYFRPESCPTPPGLDDQQATVTAWLLVLSPDPAPFATTRLLEERGVRVPQLGPAIPGAYLVEDLGDRHLHHDPSLQHYNALLDGWQPFAFEPLPPEHPNRRWALDAELFQRELGMFQERYLLAYRGLEPAHLASIGIAEACEDLARTAAEGPTCLQHRDFHSRNVLLPEGGGLAWIDHQDLRRGPLFYDLASLYTDAYLDLPDQVLRRLRGEIGPLGACFGLHLEEAQEQFQRTALQRVLKALGTFGNLLVDGREDYAEAETRARAMALALLDQGRAYPMLHEVLSG